MTIENIYQPTEYDSDGTVGPYLFAWTCLRETYVIVSVNGVILSGDEYSAQLNSDQINTPGGFVTLNTAPPVGQPIVIARATSQTQTLDLPAYTRFPSDAVENALDKLTAITQELTTRIDYSGSDISGLESRVTSNTERIDFHAAVITENYNNIAAQDSRISANKAASDGNKSDIASLKGSDFNTSDTQVMTINDSNSGSLASGDINFDLKTNRANGLAKLDAGGKVPQSLLPEGGSSYLGTWNPNTDGDTPPPGFENGQYYIFSAPGTMRLIPNDGTSVQDVDVVSGEIMSAVVGSPGQTDGWYHIADAKAIEGQAVDIDYDSAGNKIILGYNVQAALDIADGAIDYNQSLIQTVAEDAVRKSLSTQLKAGVGIYQTPFNTAASGSTVAVDATKGNYQRVTHNNSELYLAVTPTATDAAWACCLLVTIQQETTISSSPSVTILTETGTSAVLSPGMYEFVVTKILGVTTNPVTVITRIYPLEEIGFTPPTGGDEAADKSAEIVKFNNGVGYWRYPEGESLPPGGGIDDLFKQRTLTVSPDAAGGGDGSDANPYTLFEACLNAQPGDIVGVLPGVYVGVKPLDDNGNPIDKESSITRLYPAFQPAVSGLPGQPITFVAQFPAATSDGPYSDIRSGGTEIREEGTGVSRWQYRGWPAIGAYRRDHVRWVGFLLDISKENNRTWNDSSPLQFRTANYCGGYKCWIIGDKGAPWGGDNQAGVRLENTYDIEIHDCKIERFWWLEGSRDSGLVTYSAHKWDLRNNWLNDCWNGFYIKGVRNDGSKVWGNYGKIENNLFTNCGNYGAPHWGWIPDWAPEAGQNYRSTFKHNVMYNSISHWRIIGEGGFEDGGFYTYQNHLDVEYNTFHSVRTGSNSPKINWNSWAPYNGEFNDNKFRNNIVSNPGFSFLGTAYGDITGGFNEDIKTWADYDYNVFNVNAAAPFGNTSNSELSNWTWDTWAGFGNDINSLKDTDPLFIDANNGDLRLQPDSPAKFASENGTEAGAYAFNAVIGPRGDASPEVPVNELFGKRTRTVSATATGSGNGTDQAPWTLEQACELAVAGDIVGVFAGEYVSSRDYVTDPNDALRRGRPCFAPRNSGTEQQPIIFVAQNLAALVDTGYSELVTGAPQGDPNNGWPVFGTDFTSGLEADYVHWIGFYTDGLREDNCTYNDCGYATLRRTVGSRVEYCRIKGRVQPPHTNNYSGIRAETATNVILNNNVITDIGNSTAGQGVCLFFVDGYEIKHNTIDGVGQCIQLNGVSFTSPTYGEVSYNYFTNAGTGVKGGGHIEGPNGELTRIHHNLMVDCDMWMEMTKYGQNSFYSSVQCYNNTTVNADFWAAGFYMSTGPEWFQPGDPYGDNDYYNNIHYNHNGVVGYNGTTDGVVPLEFLAGYARWDYNCYAQYTKFGGGKATGTFADWQALGADLNSLDESGDPGFVDAAGGDYRLDSGSVCIGTGRDGANMGAFETGDEEIGAPTSYSRGMF
jgi:hypothetical protein